MKIKTENIVGISALAVLILALMYKKKETKQTTTQKAKSTEPVGKRANTNTGGGTSGGVLTGGGGTSSGGGTSGNGGTSTGGGTSSGGGTNGMGTIIGSNQVEATSDRIYYYNTVEQPQAPVPESKYNKIVLDKTNTITDGSIAADIMPDFNKEEYSKIIEEKRLGDGAITGFNGFRVTKRAKNFV